MGLDMYLNAKLYISDYHTPHSDEAAAAASAIDAIKWPGVRQSYKPCEIETAVGYWRKANHIHQWFVNKVQGGVDDCRNAYVDLDTLRELRDLCASLLKTRDVERAREELPTQGGFFFGSTDYDDYYWSDVKDTKTQIDAILNHPDAERFSYQYHSSW